MRRSNRRVLSRAAAAILFITLLGCATTKVKPPALHRVESQRQAGVTDVAVIYAEPWDLVAPSLIPNFDISAESALRQVIPNTTDEINRFLDAVNFRFGLGLQGSTLTRERVDTEKTGEPTSTQTTTTQRTEPGKAPDVSTSAAGDRTARALPGTDALAREIAQEPILRYKAAVALFQEVRMLNRYVQGAARGSNYVPYLVRLQITLMPFARNSPYDVYTSVSFFTALAASAPSYPKSGEACTVEIPEVAPASALKGRAPTPALPTVASEPARTPSAPVEAAESQTPAANPAPVRNPFIVPLVVTDAVEGGFTSSSAELLRNLAFGLGGTVHNIGLAVNGQSAQDALRSISGTSLNSLQTIGRLGDNGIRVRLGAVKSPIAQDAYVTVPRTHNVTLLLLAPKEWLTTVGYDNPATIAMVARTHFYDAIQGTRLPTFDTAFSHVKDLEEVGSLYMALPLEKNFCRPAGCLKDQYQGLKEFQATPEARKRRLLLYLIHQTQEGNLPCFTAALRDNYPHIREPHMLWMELTTLANSYGFSATSLQLPHSPSPEAPPSQTALLTDDGKAAATVLLRNGVALAPDRMLASLLVKDPGSQRTFEIPATSNAIAGSALRLTFPTLAKMGVMEKGIFKTGVTAELQLWQRSDIWNRSPSPYDFMPCVQGIDRRLVNPPCGSYTVVLQGTPPATEPGFKLETAVSTIPVKAGDHTGQISVYLTFGDATSAKVSATGGEIKYAHLPDAKGGPKGDPLPNEGGVITVSGKKDARVEILVFLSNLVDGTTLKVAGEGVGGDGKKTADAPPVSVAIKREQGANAVVVKPGAKPDQ